MKNNPFRSHIQNGILHRNESPFKTILAIIIVSYNTKEFLRNCIQSIFEQTKDICFEITVVDNASSDGSSEMIESEFPQVMLIKNQENVGFAKANNQGILTSTGEYVLLLNPDTVILNSALPKLVQFIQKDTSIAAVGPKLYKDEDKTYHPSTRKFTTLNYQFWAFMPLSGLVKAFYNKFIFNEDKVKEVDWVWGAALLINRKALAKIGLLDEKYFVYGEEEDLCFRMKKASYKVFYYPSAHIIHYGGQSTRQVSKESIQYFWSSKLYFFEKYYGKEKTELFIKRFLLLLKLKMKLSIISARNTDYREIISSLQDYKFSCS